MSSTTRTELRGTDSAATDHGRALRLDIEGMRAIAVGSVLVFHAGLPWFAGGFVGVDIFFVLSGFLITGLLAREVSRTGRVRLGVFWARRMRRLLPASAAVLVFSAALTLAYLPITQRKDFGGDVVSAALYVVNWRLADRAVDYLAEDVGASPVQHYWSLAVEEQFYFVWPLLLLAVGLLAAKRWRAAAFGLLGLVTASSFAWSVHQSYADADRAFFVSSTRFWELGVGALLALSATRVARLPVHIRAAAGWIGLAAIAFAVLTFDGSTRWPGIPALIPVVGAALVIASGLSITAWSPQRLLSLPPMVWIGGLSYSIYLWHWPILVAAEARHPHLQLRWTVCLMLASIIPAWLCHRLIENPVRFGSTFRPTTRAIALGGGLTVAGVAAGLVLNASVGLGDVVDEATKAQSPGAAAIADPVNQGVVWSDIRSVARMRPLPVDATKDRPRSYDDGSGCEVPAGESTPKQCVYGAKDGSRTMVLVGDSKISQWQTALDAIGRREGWKIVSITKNHCPFADAGSITGAGVLQTDCRAWGENALREVVSLRPDVVLTSQRYTTALPPGAVSRDDRSRGAMIDGLESYWRQIRNAGIPLVVVLDNPAPTTAPVYECVAEHLAALPTCSFERAEGTRHSAAPVQRAAAAGVPGVAVMDMSSTICPDQDRCPAVIGNVLVYRQGTHLTESFVDSMTPQLARSLAQATGGEFGAGRDLRRD